MVEAQSPTIVLEETSQQICMLFFIFVIVIFKNDYKLCLYKLSLSIRKFYFCGKW